MPYNPLALQELMEKENLTHNKLIKLLQDFSEKKEIPCPVNDKASVSKWKNAKPPIKLTTNIDFLYDFARSLGYTDLEFYIPPNDQKNSK